MVGSCAAPGCCRSETSNLNISYFHFPNRKKFPKLYQAWSEAIKAKYPNFRITQKLTICELHFTEEDFDDTYRLKKVLMPGNYFRPILKKDAIPKFNTQNSEVNKKPEGREIIKELLGESYLEWKETEIEEVSEKPTETAIKFEELNLNNNQIKEEIQQEKPPRVFSSTTDYILNKPLKPLPENLQKIIPSILSVILKADNTKPEKLIVQSTSTFSCFTPLQARNCELCNFSTTLKIDLDKHYKIAHRPINIAGTIKRPPMKIHRFKEPKQYGCIKCNFSTYSKLVLLKHVNTTKEYHLLEEVGTKWFRCELCPYKTTTNSNVKKHVWDKHQLKLEKFGNYKCEHCDYVNEKHKNLRKHLIKKHSYKKKNFYQCKNCFYQCVNLSMLQKHQEDKHARKNYRYFCEICDYCSEYKQYMARHVLTKHTHRFLECESCSFKTTYKLSFQSHMKKWHGK